MAIVAKAMASRWKWLGRALGVDETNVVTFRLRTSHRKSGRIRSCVAGCGQRAPKLQCIL